MVCPSLDLIVAWRREILSPFRDSKSSHPSVQGSLQKTEQCFPTTSSLREAGLQAKFLVHIGDSAVRADRKDSGGCGRQQLALEFVGTDQSLLR